MGRKFLGQPCLTIEFKIVEWSYLPKWGHEDNICYLNVLVVLAAFKTTFMIRLREMMHFSKQFNDGPLIPTYGASGP